eukprot:TRINITY_DN1475_c0_g2_i2.p2 TRINITY_DN1475_c0_g2~~TRINITY_DN1475_c0_g2_i2.p2  ORF type:complete len:185 (+),score=30.98 TRINITY_DN1475_c0_g2_i2:66-620(+)
MAEAVPIHPNLANFSNWLGRWKGTGRGFYPTISDFEYDEEIEFSHVGKPFLCYRQQTWRKADHFPLHLESGYFRALPSGRVELALTQPTGVCEIHTGAVQSLSDAKSSNDQETEGQNNDQFRLELNSEALTRTPSAKAPHVTQVRRVWLWSPSSNMLRYELYMATTTHAELTLHLEATLQKVQD